MSDYELSAIDKILDEENDDPVVLYDENGDEVQFDQVAVIPIDEVVYVILCPITPMEGVGEDEGVVFSIDEKDGEECLTLITEEDIIDKVFAEYEALVAEEDGE